jgi:hypothetical protein
MYRTSVFAIITLGTIALSVETSLAFDRGGGSAGRFGPPMASVAPVASHLPPKPGGGAVTSQVKKLSGKAAAACFRACMHGLDSSWGNFCDYSCY